MASKTEGSLSPRILIGSSSRSGRVACGERQVTACPTWVARRGRRGPRTSIDSGIGAPGRRALLDLERGREVMEARLADQEREAAPVVGLVVELLVRRATDPAGAIGRGGELGRDRDAEPFRPRTDRDLVVPAVDAPAEAEL